MKKLLIRMSSLGAATFAFATLGMTGTVAAQSSISNTGPGSVNIISNGGGEWGGSSSNCGNSCWGGNTTSTCGNSCWGSGTTTNCVINCGEGSTTSSCGNSCWREKEDDDDRNMGSNWTWKRIWNKSCHRWQWVWCNCKVQQQHENCSTQNW